MTLVDGNPAVSIPVDDRGLAYGDGLFETITLVAGSPRFWSRHMARLQKGCERLGISMPDPAVLLQECSTVARKGPRGIVKIIVTRGSGGRGYRPPAIQQARRIVAWHDYPEYPEHYTQHGIELLLSKTTLSGNAALAGIKHLNRLEQVLAQAEWGTDDTAESLILDTRGNAIEGTRTNFFTVHGNELYTPDLTYCGVEGVMRAMLLDIAAELGITVHVAPIGLKFVTEADELFVCNSVIGIWPVRTFAGRIFKQSPITRLLMDTLQPRMNAHD